MGHKNFGWIVTWRVTDRCNLNCVYCDHSVNHRPEYNETIDYENIINKLAQYQPKILNITGGEPTLVTALPEYLKTIKHRWNPFIRVVHNGTNLSKATSLFPWIDRLVISLDGPGDINRTNRGLDGDRVIDKVASIMADAKQHNVEVIINCVVTTVNAPHIDQLVRNATKLAPDLQLSFMPVIPPDGDISILAQKNMYEDFICTFDKLRNEGFQIIHVFDTILRHETFKKISCYNQFFTLRMETNGALSSCAMNVPADPAFFASKFKRFLTTGKLPNVFDRLKKMTSNAISDKPAFSCSTICNCESWLDLLFLGIQSNCHRIYTEGLRGRISDNEYTEVDQFVKEFINPQFDVTWFKRMIENVEE
ncbi:MAG TPA: radical SAM protein [Chitinispirillaceae bacterium]|nr:radical SAM protein [Chitinispirillaceae bacterium]